MSQYPLLCPPGVSVYPCPHHDLLCVPSTRGPRCWGGGVHGAPALPREPHRDIPQAIPRAVVQGPGQVPLLHVSTSLLSLLCTVVNVCTVVTLVYRDDSCVPW